MKYELMVILTPKLSEKDLEKTLKEIKGSITENGFSVTDEDVWGHRRLAYKIKNYEEGYYVVMTFEGESAGTVELKKELRLQGGMIRHMLIKTADDHMLVRTDNMTTPGNTKKLSKHAEELSKKVTAKKKEKVEDKGDEAPAAEEPKKDAELDEKLQAIVDDADIDL